MDEDVDVVVVGASCDTSVLLPSNPPNNSVTHTTKVIVVVVIVVVVDDSVPAAVFRFVLVIVFDLMCFISSF